MYFAKFNYQKYMYIQEQQGKNSKDTHHFTFPSNEQTHHFGEETCKKGVKWTFALKKPIDFGKESFLGG